MRENFNTPSTLCPFTALTRKAVFKSFSLCLTINPYPSREWPRRDSNAYQEFRKLFFYPLNYKTKLTGFHKQAKTMLRQAKWIINLLMKKTLSNVVFPSTESNRFLRPNLTGGEMYIQYVQCTLDVLTRWIKVSANLTWCTSPIIVFFPAYLGATPLAFKSCAVWAILILLYLNVKELFFNVFIVPF